MGPRNGTTAARHVKVFFVPRCQSCGQRWITLHSNCPNGAPVAKDEAPALARPGAFPRVPGHALQRTLARGGFGTLFAGVREWDGLKVAVKVAHPEHPLANAQLSREAAALSKLGAPAAPALHDTGHLDDGTGYLVMELIEWPTLAELLGKSPGPLGLDAFAAHAHAVVDAVAQVHVRGFLHCDLKPENLLVTNTPPEVRLVDFGLSQSLLPVTSLPTPLRSVVVTIQGTVEYMSPEQCTGQVELDVRSDLYALGVILYELLTGAPPFFGPNHDVLQAHLTRRPQRPSEKVPVPLGLDDVLLRLLAKERTRRYASISELSAALRDVLSRKPEALAPRPSPATPEASRPGSTRRPMAILFLTLHSDAVTTQAALTPYGGQLAFSADARCAAVFDLDAGENPVKRAFRAAEGVIGSGLAAAGLLDVAPVTVQRRANGAARFFGSIFNRKELYPDAECAGVLCTTAATAVLPELRFVPMPGREDLYQLAPPDDAPETASFFRVGIDALVGREQELLALVAAARDAVGTRRPGIATVFADPGYGKSHFCLALTRALQERFPKARILALRAREPLQGDVDETLRSLLYRSFELPEATAAHAPRDLGRSQLSQRLGRELGEELWPAVAVALGWLTAESPEIKKLGAAPGVLRSMALRAAGEGLRAHARTTPLLLLLDDAHFAEDVSLDALEYAALAEAGLPLWICLLARPSLERARPQLGLRAAHRETLRLGTLDDKSAEELCRLLLRPAFNVPAEAVKRILERTQRIPLYVVELIHGLKRQGLVRPRPGGTWYLATDELELIPELPLVEWLADREQGVLPPELLPYVRLCALLESEFSSAEVEGTVRELERSGGATDFPLDPGHAMHRLLELGLLKELGPPLMGFRNPLLRSIVSRAVPAAEQARLHHAAFRFYVHHWREPEERRLPRIAVHAAGAGMREEAAALYLDLAEGARQRHAYLEAEATYSRAIELLGEHQDVMQLAAHQGRGMMRYRVGRHEDSLADFALARALAKKRQDVRAEVELLLDEATALDWIADYPGSEKRVGEAEQLMSGLKSPDLFARLKLATGRSQFRKGRRKEANQSLAEAAALSETLENAGYETLVVSLALRGVVLPDLGQIDEAEQVVGRVIALCSERRDRLHLASAINNRRNLWVARKNLAKAVEDQRVIMQFGRELGMVNWEYIAEYNLGELYYHAGLLEEADGHNRRALELERRHPEIAPKPLAVLLRARLHAYRGEREQARGMLNEVQGSIRRARIQGRSGAELVPSEEVLYRLVELCTQEATAAEWEALRAESREKSVEQEPLEVAELMALFYLGQGRVEDALWHLEDAQRMAKTLPNLMDERIRRTLERARRLSEGRRPAPVDSRR